MVAAMRIWRIHFEEIDIEKAAFFAESSSNTRNDDDGLFSNFCLSTIGLGLVSMVSQTI